LDLTENRHMNQTPRWVCTIYSGKNDERRDADGNVSY